MFCVMELLQQWVTEYPWIIHICVNHNILPRNEKNRISNPVKFQCIMLCNVYSGNGSIFKSLFSHVLYKFSYKHFWDWTVHTIKCYISVPAQTSNMAFLLIFFSVLSMFGIHKVPSIKCKGGYVMCLTVATGSANHSHSFSLCSQQPISKVSELFICKVCSNCVIEVDCGSVLIYSNTLLPNRMERICPS